MEGATDAAVKAAQEGASVLFERGVLGVVCVALFAMVCVMGFVIWKLVSGRIEAEKGFRTEIGSAHAAVFTSMDTLDKALDLVRTTRSK